MTIIIGIVPGAKAAFACGAWVYPIEHLRNFLAARKPDEVLHAFLEWPIPVQKLMPSVRADHSMGVAQGRIVGLLEAFEGDYALLNTLRRLVVLLILTLPAVLRIISIFVIVSIIVIGFPKVSNAAVVTPTESRLSDFDHQRVECIQSSDSNLWAMARNEFLTSEIDRSVSSQPQCASKNRYNERGKRGNAGTISVQGYTETGDSGWGFIVGLVTFLVWWIAYALMEGWK